MKNKKLLIGIIIAVAVVVVMAVVSAVILMNRTGKGSMIIDNGEDGVVTVTAENAGNGSGGLGYVTLADGQKLEVTANLEENSAINIEVWQTQESTVTDAMTEESDQLLQEIIGGTSQVLLEETFTGTDARSFALPSGDYSILITAQEGATGDMTIKASGESDAGDNTASAAD